MCSIPIAFWISNAAVRFSGIRGAVSIQARRVGCSRQAIGLLSRPPRGPRKKRHPLASQINITAKTLRSGVSRNIAVLRYRDNSMV